MKHFSHILSTMILTIAVMACANQSSKPELSLDQQLEALGYTNKTQTERINNYRLNGWRYVNDSALIINSSPKRHYLITLSQKCWELASAVRIAVDSDAEAVSRFNKVIVTDGVRNTVTCQIDNIYTLDKKPISEQ